MKTILIVADYAAAYRGNFIPSIESIAVYLQKHGLVGDKACVAWFVQKKGGGTGQLYQDFGTDG